jgi:hypothetical protein
MLVIALLLAGCAEQIEECDTAAGPFCVDHRGYEHEIGTYWQCENSCDVCLCDENGEVVIAEVGPVITSENCEEKKFTGQQLPKSLK